MPVRSSSSRVLRWPDAEAVDGAVRTWAARLGDAHPEVLRVAYFGSYARGDWGVGSDVDLIVIVTRREVPPGQARTYPCEADLPVHADQLVYTLEEWDRLPRDGRFWRTLDREAVWVYARPAEAPLRIAAQGR